MTRKLDTTGSADTLRVLKGMYTAEVKYLAAGGPGNASFNLLAPFFSPDVVLHQADAFPYGGEWRGHDGMERFMLAMSQTWELFEMVDQQFLATEGTAVVLAGRTRPCPCDGQGARLPDSADDRGPERPHQRRSPLLVGHGRDRHRVHARGTAGRIKPR